MTDKKLRVPLSTIASFAAHATEMIEDALYHRHAGERESGGNVRRGTRACKSTPTKVAFSEIGGNLVKLGRMSSISAGVNCLFYFLLLFAV